MDRFRHHTEWAAEAGGFRARLAGARGCFEQPVSWRQSEAGQVGAAQAVAVETAFVLRMARDGFVPRLDLRPDVFGERQAAERRTDVSFAALAAPGIGAGQRRAFTLKEDLFA